MEDFLNKYYAIITFAIVFLPAIVGLSVYKKYKETIIKYFIWFCVYIVFVEIIGAYPVYIDKFESLHFLNESLKGSIFENSHWWYFIFWTFASALFYAFYFYNLLNNIHLKRIIKYLSFLFVCIYVFNFIKNINDIVSNPNSFYTISSALLIVVVVLVYFVEVLNSDKIVSIFKSVNFYIGAALLLWHLIMTPLTFYNIYFNRSDMDYAILHALIYLSCNTFMYLTFSFALLWCKPQNN